MAAIEDVRPEALISENLKTSSILSDKLGDLDSALCHVSGLCHALHLLAEDMGHIQSGAPHEAFWALLGSMRKFVSDAESTSNEIYHIVRAKQ